MEEIINGALYLVATPIGNLADITYRAVHILNNVNLIAAEDTRKSGVLLKHYGVHTPVRSYHSYNIKNETPKLADKLLNGFSIALITDAGMPGISDPGYHLVQACVENDLRVIPVPGASAFLAGLVVSGLPVNRFVYEGFLPLKKGRKTRIAQLESEERTLVFYESPHRIQKTTDQLLAAWGDRRCVMARELTKKFEEIFRGTLAQLAEHLTQKPIKGEFVLIVEGKSGKRGN